MFQTALGHNYSKADKMGLGFTVSFRDMSPMEAALG